MNATAVLGTAITVAGFIIGIITTVARLSMDYGKIKKEFEKNDERDKEDRAHTREKFSEIYGKLSVHDSSLSGLKNNVSNLTLTCERIESKLDRLIEKESK